MSNQPVNIAVIGSRSFRDYPFVEKVLNAIHAQTPIDAIISGGAMGADTLAEVWAQLHDVKMVIHEAKWDDIGHKDAHIKINKYGNQYDALAGHRRNEFIINDGMGIIAFWDGKSPGTENSIKYAKTQSKAGVVYLYNEEGIVHGKFNLRLDNSYQPLNAG